MIVYRAGRSHIARKIAARERQRANIAKLRASGQHELADRLERLGRAVDQRGVAIAPAPGAAGAPDTATDLPPVPWWDR